MPRKYRDCENNRKDGKVDYACGIESRGKIVKKKGKNCVAGRGNIDYVCGTKSKGADVKEYTMVKRRGPDAGTTVAVDVKKVQKQVGAKIAKAEKELKETKVKESQQVAKKVQQVQKDAQQALNKEKEKIQTEKNKCKNECNTAILTPVRRKACKDACTKVAKNKLVKAQKDAKEKVEKVKQGEEKKAAQKIKGLVKKVEKEKKDGQVLVAKAEEKRKKLIENNKDSGKKTTGVDVDGKKPNKVTGVAEKIKADVDGEKLKSKRATSVADEIKADDDDKDRFKGKTKKEIIEMEKERYNILAQEATELTVEIDNFRQQLIDLGISEPPRD